MTADPFFADSSNNYTWDLDYLDNSTGVNATKLGEEDSGGNYWALLLVVVPIVTIFGNILVILSVYRERTLQTVTNYFIVSLALADLLVAVGAMPFAVYALSNGQWGLPPMVCDFYIATDVTCSTSSILNLVAISIDRYIAVTKPIKYAKHKNNKRAWLTIVLVWVISAAIGSPIVLGLNNTPKRVAHLCMFYNSDFILYSSLTSFYIPCIIMIYLYYSIFKALRLRAQRAKASRRPHVADSVKPSIVIENVAQTRKLAETTLGAATLLQSSCGGGGGASSYLEEAPTGSGSQDDEDEADGSPSDECHVISNEKTADLILATVVEERTMLATISQSNHDSGYGTSNVEETTFQGSPPTPRTKSAQSAPDDRITRIIHSVSVQKDTMKSNGSLDSEMNTETVIRNTSTSEEGKSTQEMETVTATASTAIAVAAITTSKAGSDVKKERKASAAARFTIYKVNKASRKKREKSSAKKERKATKTLAIVLGVFLICWLPFFTCNIADAICSKIKMDCSPGVTAFILTTWLGYMNSFVNPIIYTIFNPEFRKAFKKIMRIETR